MQAQAGGAPQMLQFDLFAHSWSSIALPAAWIGAMPGIGMLA